MRAGLGRILIAVGLALALLIPNVAMPSATVGADDDDAALKEAFDDVGLEWFDGTEKKGKAEKKSKAETKRKAEKKSKKKAANPPAGSGDSGEEVPPPEMPEDSTDDPTAQDAAGEGDAAAGPDATVSESDLAPSLGSRLTRDERFVLGLFLLGVLADYGPGGLFYSLLTGIVISVDVQAKEEPATPSFVRSDDSDEGTARTSDGPTLPEGWVMVTTGKSLSDPAAPGARVIADLVTKAVAAAAADAPHPSKRPPKSKLGKKRTWVSLPAAAIVYGGAIGSRKGSLDERTLKSGVWYQMRDLDDGTRAFYDKKGDYLGFNFRDEVWVRLWKPKTDE